MRRISLSKIWIGIALLTGANSSFAQFEGYQYVREVSAVPADSYYTIALTPDIRKRMTRGMDDVRLFEIGSADTIETPFLIRTHEEYYKQTSVPIRILNRGMTTQGYQLMLALDKAQVANQIDLSVGESNFDWRVRVEGSVNRQEWVELSPNARILAITNPYIEYHYTSLRFDDSDFPFYRLTVLGIARPVGSLSAAMYDDRRSQASYDTLSGVHWQTETKDKTTIVTATLPDSLPVSRIILRVNHDRDYHRRLSILRLRSTIQTEKGPWEDWETVSSSVLSSVEPSTFTFATLQTRKLRMEIANRDDQPLDVQGEVVLAVRSELVAELRPGRRYLLAYGNPLAVSPEYDLAYFADRIPKRVERVAMGDEMSMAEAREKASALFENQVWLWVAILAIILILGVFSIRLLKKSASIADSSS